MTWSTSRDRAAKERRAKLEHIRNQVDSGALVIREMTLAERMKWTEQRAKVEARFTQIERARRDAVLKQRRLRAANRIELENEP